MGIPDVVLSNIEIPVADLKRAIDWYRQALGLACTWSDDHHATLAGGDGGLQILLVRTDDPARLRFTSTETGLTHAVIDFRTEDLEALHAHLEQLGGEVEPLRPPPNEWAPRGFAFADSEGNQLAAFSYKSRAE